MSFTLVTIVHDAGNFDFKDVEKRIKSVYESAEESGRPFDLILIDNSKRPIIEIQNLASDLNCIHHWCDGYNTFHGPSMNIAASMSNKEAIVYFCASHGHVVDHGWIHDILAPLSERSCGIAGCIGPCLFDRVSADHEDWKRPQEHIQGAVTAMRRELLLEIPYSHRFPFEYSDVMQSLQIVQRGYEMVHVDSIRSVGIGRARTQGAKYIHDYR